LLESKKQKAELSLENTIKSANKNNKSQLKVLRIRETKNYIKISRELFSNRM